MQKKIVALAVAGLSTAAFAQTNVTIYGVADVSGQGTSATSSSSTVYQAANGVGTTVGSNATKGTHFGIQSNNSLIGFKGTEDLGNGISALFQMETNVNLQGTGTQAQAYGNGGLLGTQRDSFAGVSSKYGTALAGYLSTPFRSAVVGLDVFPGATGSAAIVGLFGRTRTIANGGGNVQQDLYTTSNYTAAERATAIAYVLPTLYGFNGQLAYTGNGSNNLQQCNGLNACSNNANGVSALSMNLGWTGYGVGIIGAFQQTHVSNATLANNAGALPGNLASGYTNYMVGAQYTGVPGLKVATAYGRAVQGYNAAPGAGAVFGGLPVRVNGDGAAKATQNQIWVGASYRFGNNEPRIMYANNSNSSGLSQYTSGNALTGVNNSMYAGQNGASQWGLGWGYYLSKRTQVYGIVSQVKNNANGTYDFAVSSNTAQNGGVKLTTYGAGLRTNF